MGGEPATAPARRPLRRTAWVGLRLLPLLVSGGCLWWLATHFDWSAVGAALTKADWRLAAAVATLMLVYIVLRALRFRLMLGPGAPAFGTLLRVYTLSVAVAVIIPGSGELVRAVVLGRQAALSTAYVLGAVTLEKGVDTGLTLALMLLGLWAAALRDEQTNHLLLGTALVVSAGLFLGGALLGALARWVPPGAAWTPPGWLSPRAAALLARGVARGLAAAERFGSGVRALWGLPRHEQGAVAVLTLVSWLTTWLMTLAALAAFGLAAQGALAAVLWGALVLGLSVPSAPGGLGPFQVVAVTVLQAFDQPAAPALAFAIGFHALMVAPALLAGAIASFCGRPNTPAPPAE
jgi:uncharacterized membrane protein YbhN (UPF0104 family)